MQRREEEARRRLADAERILRENLYKDHPDDLVSLSANSRPSNSVMQRNQASSPRDFGDFMGSSFNHTRHLLPPGYRTSFLQLPPSIFHPTFQAPLPWSNSHLRPPAQAGPPHHHTPSAPLHSQAAHHCYTSASPPPLSPTPKERDQNINLSMSLNLLLPLLLYQVVYHLHPYIHQLHQPHLHLHL